MNLPRPYQAELAAALLLATLLAATPLNASSHSAPSATATTVSWQEVGRATLRVLWFHIYDARLETPTGRFENYRQPLRLSLRYKRNIERDELLAETDKQLQTFASAQQRQRWLGQLQRLWPDIRKGDELIFQTAAQGAGFYHNGVWLGRVNDPTFAPAFVQIWLSERSEYPRLARQLRGE